MAMPFTHTMWWPLVRPTDLSSFVFSSKADISISRHCKAWASVGKFCEMSRRLLSASELSAMAVTALYLPAVTKSGYHFHNVPEKVKGNLELIVARKLAHGALPTDYIALELGKLGSQPRKVEGEGVARRRGG